MGQMIALAYGTLPIVHATGGLKDSVKDARAQDRWERENANGYHISSPLTANSMKNTLWAALETYQKNRQEHVRLMKNGMRCNFYWPKAIEEYERHFDYTFSDPS